MAKKNAESWKIKTIEEAYKKTGRSKIDFSIFPEDVRNHMENYYHAIVITEAVNEGWRPNWDDYSEYKWLPWFRMSASSFAFYVSDCDRTHAFAGSGSRLRFESEEKSDYVVKTFPEVFKSLQIGQ